MKSKKLTLPELFEESGEKLPRFVGILVKGGKQKDYLVETANIKAGEKPKKFMTIDEYNKLKKEYLEN